MTSNDCSQTVSSRVMTSGPMVISFCSTCLNTSASGSSSNLISESNSLSFIMTKLQKTIGNISNDKSSGAIFARMCSWRFYVDYLIHFVCSNSRHGTHSPFVYGLVDKVFYGKRQPGEPRDKVERLIARLTSRFQPSAVYTLGDPLPQQLDFVVVKGGDPEWI